MFIKKEWEDTSVVLNVSNVVIIEPYEIPEGEIPQ